MKQKSMKSYVIDRLTTYLSEYHEKNFRYKYLYLKSEKDIRLAELAQAYFYLSNDKRADSFMEFTEIKFDNKSEFEHSNTKYVLEYVDYLKRKGEMKTLYRKKLLEYFKEKNITMYRASKMAGTNQSNLSQFFLKFNDSALSEEKLSQLLKQMKE